MVEELDDIDADELATAACVVVVDEEVVVVVAVAVDETIGVVEDAAEGLPIKATAAVEEAAGHSRT